MILENPMNNPIIRQDINGIINHVRGTKPDKFKYAIMINLRKQRPDHFLHAVDLVDLYFKTFNI